MRWLKQGPLLVWFHDTVTLVPFTSGSARMGGLAVSVQVEQGEKQNEYTVSGSVCSYTTAPVASVQVTPSCLN